MKTVKKCVKTRTTVHCPSLTAATPNRFAANFPNCDDACDCGIQRWDKSFETQKRVGNCKQGVNKEKKEKDINISFTSSSCCCFASIAASPFDRSLTSCCRAFSSSGGVGFDWEGVWYNFILDQFLLIQKFQSYNAYPLFLDYIHRGNSTIVEIILRSE